MTRRNWVREFRAAAAVFDWSTVTELASAYVSHIHALPILPDSISPVLQTLRQALRHTEIELIADAALTLGSDTPVVRRQYAQALVDGGHPVLALRLYTELAADEALSIADRVEARGGIGRCYKELFLACTEPERRRHYLARSCEAYLSVYRLHPGHTWHGINAVALLARAERDGIDLATEAPPAEMAEAILKAVDEAPLPDAWTEVTACEASVALERFDDAIERAEAFIEARPDGFTVAAFHRQLRTVWQLDTTSSPGTELLALFRSALLRYDGGHVTVEPTDVRAARLEGDLADGRLEAILGTDRFVPLAWYRNGLLRCRAVARVQTLSDVGVATGFLVAGPDLHPDLPPLVVLTNGHAIPEGMRPAKAVLAFHGLADDPGRQARFCVKRQCWYQPSRGAGLDTTILELDGYPEGVDPTPLATALPRKPLDNQRAYVIGHPRGLSQPQFSLHNTVLLDYDQRVVHYRSPTETGSSGSPVFDDDWELIGLHHFGSAGLPQLNGVGGTYPANEGITIDAIRTALAAYPPETSV